MKSEPYKYLLVSIRRFVEILFIISFDIESNTISILYDSNWTSFFSRFQTRCQVQKKLQEYVVD